MTRATRREGGHSVEGLFSFVLLALFAVLALLLVVIGTQIYRGVVKTADENAVARTAANYLLNQLRAADAEGAIELRDIDGARVLVFRGDYDGDAYETRIYCHNGALCEQFTSSGVPFDPENGEALTPLAALDMELEANSLVKLSLTGLDGKITAVRYALRAGGGEETRDESGQG